MTIDPIKVLRLHVKSIVLSGIVGIVLGVGAYIGLALLYPLYTAEIQFEIRPGLTEATDIGTADTSKEDVVNRIAKTQTQIIVMREILEVAVQNPDMLETAWLQDNFIDPETGTVLIEQAVDELEDGWHPAKTPIYRGSNLFGIRWSAHRASDVPKVLNAIADAYVKKISQLDEQLFADNEELFEKELRRTRLALQDLSDEIQAFIRAKGITTLDDPRYSYAAFEMEQLTAALTETRAKLQGSRTALIQTSALVEGTLEPTMEEVYAAELDISVQRQIQLLQALKADLMAMRERYAPGHPQVLELESSVRATEIQRNAKIEEIINRNLHARMKMLENEIASHRGLLVELGTEMEAKDALLRDLAADQSYYEQLVTQREHLEAQRDSTQQLIMSVRLMKLRADASRVRRVGVAVEPRERSFPLPQVIVPLCMVLCAGGFTGLIFFREISDQRIKSASDLFIIPGMRLIGAIPELEEDPLQAETAELVVSRSPRSVLAESYRQACASPYRGMARAGHQSLLMVGAMPQCGTTTAVTNFALTASASGKKVVVIDANFRRPRLCSLLDLDDDDPGLGDLLAGDVTLDEVLRETTLGIGVISAGTPANRIFERLNTAALDQLLAELRSRSDLVIIDAPPAIVAGDALILANKVDAVALIVRAWKDQRGLVSRLMRELGDTRSEVLGVLLNRPRFTAGGYFRKNYEAMAEYAAAENGKST